MMNQMMQAMGNQQGEAEGEGPDQNGNRSADDRDPLGRPRATTGPDFGSRVQVPDEIDIQRAREILDAIRKRLGDQLSPEIEKRYLERLLDLQESCRAAGRAQVWAQSGRLSGKRFRNRLPDLRQ
jgi:hypothetical protein